MIELQTENILSSGKETFFPVQRFSRIYEKSSKNSAYIKKQ